MTHGFVKNPNLSQHKGRRSASSKVLPFLLIANDMSYSILSRGDDFQPLPASWALTTSQAWLLQPTSR